MFLPKILRTHVATIRVFSKHSNLVREKVEGNTLFILRVVSVSRNPFCGWNFISRRRSFIILIPFKIYLTQFRKHSISTFLLYQKKMILVNTRKEIVLNPFTEKSMKQRTKVKLSKDQVKR